MKFTTGIVSFLLTSALTAAAPLQNIQKRTAATVLTDINTISGYVAALTSAAKTYTGSRLQSFALALIVDNLEDSLTTATTDTTASAAFDSSDSDNILTAITVLTPNFVTLLDDLETIAPTIATAGYTSSILNALNILAPDTTALFAALDTKLDAADAATLASLEATLNDSYATAIAAY